MSERLQDPISPTTPPPIYIAPAASTGLTDNLAAALAYVTIIPAIVFLILEPYNRFPLVRFHSFQSIGFCVASLVLQIGLIKVEGFLHFIPLSWIIFGAVNAVVGLGMLFVWLVVVYKAYNGEFYNLPIVSDFAEKQIHS